MSVAYDETENDASVLVFSELLVKNEVNWPNSAAVDLESCIYYLLE